MIARYRHNGQMKEIAVDCAVPETGSRNNFSLSVLETVLNAVVRQGGVSTNVFNNRPKAVSPTVNDFAVVKTMGGLDDYNTFGGCSVDFALFAKDGAGFKNTKRLGLMHDRLLAYLPYEIEVFDSNSRVAAYMLDEFPRVMPDAPDDFGFHCRMIIFNATIKVIR